MPKNLTKARKVYNVITIPANTNSPIDYVLAGPPKGKQWVLYNMAADTPANVSVTSFTLVGENLGLYSVGGYAEFSLITNFGGGVAIDYGDEIKVQIGNTTAASVDVGLSLYIKETDV